MALLEKGLQWETTWLDLPSGEHKNPEYLAINPVGKVPALIDGTTIVHDSTIINEYLEEFHRGDFLIRNLIGADPKSGTLAVGAYPRAGQTIQFQRRDAAAGTEDMTSLLAKLREQTGDRTIYGACVCSCNGRGHRLFG